jgi:hypothetical protein
LLKERERNVTRVRGERVQGRVKRKRGMVSCNDIKVTCQNFQEKQQEGCVGGVDATIFDEEERRVERGW